MRAPEPESRGADPVRVFVILTAILVAIGALYWFTRYDPAPDTEAAPTSATGSPNFSLTNAEAITRFKELDRLRQRAYTSRDSSLILQIYASSSPAKARALNDLRTLRADQVMSRTTFRTLRLTVTSNGGERVGLEQIVIVDPRFVNESGDSIDDKNPTQRLTIEWTLAQEKSEWLLFDSVIAASEVVK